MIVHLRTYLKMRREIYPSFHLPSNKVASIWLNDNKSDGTFQGHARCKDEEKDKDIHYRTKKAQLNGTGLVEAHRVRSEKGPPADVEFW